MDKTILVEHQINDGQKLVDELPQQGFDVPAAFWIKTSYDGRWHFYIVSPIADTNGRVEAYRQLNQLVRDMPPLWIDPMEIKLIGASDPIAQDVIAVLSRGTG